MPVIVSASRSTDVSAFYLDTICPNNYFQFTLNDYDSEGIEPNVPSLSVRIEAFKRLSERVGRDRVIREFSPDDMCEVA